ncbi:hypothetical protein CDAR_498281 [Caerostris darwini]|uniref:Uncharacterized protein n=1 Tax=Caerostris darwini TaxID=1538125 RepID=A0AAV4U009_9ARAC|nr:hypothetical protein CDAR_498281 [Caerostris darwini]
MKHLNDLPFRALKQQIVGTPAASPAKSITKLTAFRHRWEVKNHVVFKKIVRCWNKFQLHLKARALLQHLLACPHAFTHSEIRESLSSLIGLVISFVTSSHSLRKSWTIVTMTTGTRFSQEFIQSGVFSVSLCVCVYFSFVLSRVWTSATTPRPPHLHGGGKGRGVPRTVSVVDSFL